MLVLNKEKEGLLTTKYGFVDRPELRCYKFGKSIVIYYENHPKWSCQLKFNSMSKLAQDLLYVLVKDNVLIKVPNEDKSEKILKLQQKIEQLEEKIKRLEGN